MEKRERERGGGGGRAFEIKTTRFNSSSLPTHLRDQQDLFAAEAGEPAPPDPVRGGFFDRQLALLEDTAARDRQLRREHDEVIRLLSHDMRAPQSAILGLHSINDRPVAVNGQVVIRPMMYLALSYDHRLVDGKEAVTFLVKVKQAIEDPSRLLLAV